MTKAIIVFRDIYCTPVSQEHIKQGWLSWMNDPVTTERIDGGNRKYSEADLSKYLSETESIFFLACYSKKHRYFGNLRIYNIAPNVASFGRLIGCNKHRGRGYGKLMCDLANSLIFDYKNYDAVIVGNKKGSKASAHSKVKSGFQLIDDDHLSALDIKSDSDSDFYLLKKSDYYANLA